MIILVGPSIGGQGLSLTGVTSLLITKLNWSCRTWLPNLHLQTRSRRKNPHRIAFPAFMRAHLMIYYSLRNRLYLSIFQTSAFLPSSSSTSASLPTGHSDSSSLLLHNTPVLTNSGVFTIARRITLFTSEYHHLQYQSLFLKTVGRTPPLHSVDCDNGVSLLREELSSL